MARDFKLLSGLKKPYREYGGMTNDRVVQPKGISGTRASNLINKPQVGYNTQYTTEPKNTGPTFNGRPKPRAAASPTAKPAILGKPKTAALVKKSTRSVPLASSTPPVPRAKASKASAPASKPSLKFRLQAALKSGKDNQALAKKRMLARTHRG